MRSGSGRRPCFDGGHTVVAYGSHNCDGIDTIQLDIGWDLRQSETISRFTEALAASIGHFYLNYLQDPIPALELSATRDGC